MVMNTLDSGPGSLRQAVLDANANAGADTIVFAKGVSGTIKLTSGELLITDSVAINGPGANKLSVSGNNASRVFEINGGPLDPTIDVTISGLTITHGYAPDDGGGIKNDVANLTTLSGANLTLSADNLTQNVAYESSLTVPADELAATLPTGDPVAGPSGFGGGVESLGGALTITACQITGNRALGGAGASRFGEALGGGISILGGSRATISNSTFSGNLARGGDNSTDGRALGGGLGTWVPATITDCTFSDNVAHTGDNTPLGQGAGGGLDFEPSSTGNIISGSTFSGNQAVGGNGGTGTARYGGNNGVAYGGAIVTLGTLSISGSTFDHNQALAGSGGNSVLVSPFPTVDYAQGGAIYNQTGFAPAVIDITTSTFSHNQAVGGNNSTATVTDGVNSGGAEGGALDNVGGSTMTVSYSTLDHNQAIGGNGNTASSGVLWVGTGLGGAIASDVGGPGFPNTLTVSNCTLTQNSATGGDNNHGTATVTGLVGAGAGAGIANFLGSTASVSDSDLDHNQASGGRHNTADGGGAVFPGLGAGAGIFNWLGKFNSLNVGSFGDSVVTVSDCLIDHNQVQGGGGGSALGGGIANLLSATTAVTGSTLTNNQANGDGGGAGLGGGAYNDATSSLTLNATTVTKNHANGQPGIGGGIYNLGAFTFDVFTVIADNHASTSGDNIGP
jgi:hypothetical protein